MRVRLLETTLICCCAILSAAAASWAQTSELQQHIVWSIAHEGCRAYTKTDPRVLADTLKPAPDLRACYLAVERDAGASQLLISATDPELIDATIQALKAIPAQYHVAENFEWVLDHENQRGTIQELDRNGDFESIRALFDHFQSHNPDARNILSGFTDSELHQLINRQRLTVSVEKNAQYDTLFKISTLADTKPFTAAIETTLGDIAKWEYGSNSADVLRLIADSNPDVFKKSLWNVLLSVFKKGSRPVSLSETIAQGTKLKLPYIVDPGSVSLVPLKWSVSVESAQAIVAKSKLPATVEPEIHGKIEEPINAVLATTSTTANGYTNWYMKASRADQIAIGDLNKGNNDILIGVVDGGVDIGQPRLIDFFWKVPHDLIGDPWIENTIGYDYFRDTPNPYDEMGDSHGTHVAGIVTGRPVNEFYSGLDQSNVKSHLKIVVLKVAGKDKQFDYSRAENAIEDGIVNGIHIFNLSFQGPTSRILRRDVTARHAVNNELFVIAAGNETKDLGSNLGIHVTFRDRQGNPLPNVIFVAATDDLGKMAKFSNYGNTVVQIAAPGVQIPSTVKNSGFAPLSGTSMAAPFVTMTAALILSQKPSMPIPQVRRRILSTCDFDPTIENSVIDGCKLDVAKAVSLTTDIVELRSGTFIRGTVDPSQFTVASGNDTAVPLDNNPNSVVRIWMSDDGRTRIITSSEKKWAGTLTNPKISIHLDAGNLCPAGSGEMCALDLSSVRDVTFRQR